MIRGVVIAGTWPEIIPGTGLGNLIWCQRGILWDQGRAIDIIQGVATFVGKVPEV